MLVRRTSLALLAALIAWTASATAQQSPIQPDSVRAEISTSLRAFYFNLAHGDWEALTADILAAKVVASRSAPQAMVQAAASAAAEPAACSTERAALVDNAIITLDGSWAEVSVPRCPAALAGADEFRLIRFEEHWRFVYIDLFEGRVNLSTGR